MTLPVSIDDVRAAHERIARHVHRTPIVRSRSLDDRYGARLYLKCENLQRVGAFKIRGAMNAVLSLSDADAACGVATHSSGNHGAALSLAARERGIPAYVVVPRSAPAVKRAAIAGYGGTIFECEPTLADRLATLERVVERTGAVIVPPYDDARVVAGAGTAALELFADVDARLDAVWTPVGGGGLAAGTAVVATAVAPGIELVAAEPAVQDDALRSLATGVIQPSLDALTVADGLRTSLGEIPFKILRACGTRVCAASEESILAATLLVWERTKLIIEPSSAVPLAAMLEHPEEVRGKTVGVILSGGNVDFRALLQRF